MIHIVLNSADELRELPSGAVLTSANGDRLVWQRPYRRPHPDPDTGIWTLPRNPFIEWDVAEIEAELPDPDEEKLSGNEPWLSTLDDPHDTSNQP